MDEPDDDDLDAPPPFPLPESHQRSKAQMQSPAPSFAVSAPSPPGSPTADEPPSELNIAILKDPIPLGDMAPPFSTTTKPAFGMQQGGLGEGEKAAKPKELKSKGKRGKVALGPGFSALDWSRLTKSGRDLTGTGGMFQRVTMDELKKVSPVELLTRRLSCLRCRSILTDSM